MLRTILVTLLFVLPASLMSADGVKYQKITQGDWAVVLVRGLNLDANKPLEKVQDFTKLLEKVQIVPQDGWKIDRMITESDYLGTLGKALIYLNSQKVDKKQAEFDRFFAFLEDKVGLDLSQLLALLPRNGNLQNLTDGLANYISSKTGASGSDTRPGAESTASGTKSKITGGGNSGPGLAAVSSPVASLAAALTAYAPGPGPSNPDYWNIFSKPASPILPN
ncbi:hypothetical protein LLH00_16865 [bacterium]|nr:hypothetical protein [bacterium]